MTLPITSQMAGDALTLSSSAFAQRCIMSLQLDPERNYIFQNSCRGMKMSRLGMHVKHLPSTFEGLAAPTMKFSSHRRAKFKLKSRADSRQPQLLEVRGKPMANPLPPLQHLCHFCIPSKSCPLNSGKAGSAMLNPLDSKGGFA